MVADANWHITEVGSEADLDALGAEGEADGIGSVVGDGERRDFDVADAKAAAGEEMLGLGEIGSFAGVFVFGFVFVYLFVSANSAGKPITDGAIPGVVRAFGEVDGNVEFGGQALESGNMVGMLVRDEDGGNIFGAFAEAAQTLEGLAAGEAGIDQNAR